MLYLPISYFQSSQIMSQMLVLESSLRVLHSSLLLTLPHAAVRLTSKHGHIHSLKWGYDRSRGRFSRVRFVSWPLLSACCTHVRYDHLVGDVSSVSGIPPEHVLMFLEDGTELKEEVLLSAWERGGEGGTSSVSHFAGRTRIGMVLSDR